MTHVWEFWNPNLVISTLKKGATAKMEKACIHLVDEIKADMMTSKSGITYHLADLGAHVAAADGESPAKRYGRLMDGLEYRVIEVGDQIIGQVGVNLDSDDVGYAYYLEIGWTVGGNFHIKPYLRKVTFEQEEAVKRILS